MNLEGSFSFLFFFLSEVEHKAKGILQHFDERGA